MGTLIRPLARRISAFVLVLVPFVVGRCVIAAGSTAAVFPDTDSYRRGPNTGAVELISWTGHAYRLWGVPVFYALLPSDHARVLAQWALGTIAWAALAGALWLWLHTLAARLIAASAVLCLGLMTSVTNWDFALLSESLTLSLGVLVVAMVLIWKRSGSWWAMAVLSAAVVVWAFTRPEIAILLAFLAVSLALHLWRDRSHRVSAVVGLVAVVGALGWSVPANMAVERNHANPYSAGGTVSEELLVYRLGLQVYPDPAVEHVFSHDLGMPACPGLAAQARKEWNIVDVPIAYGRCPALQAWAHANAGTIGLRFAVAAPRTFARVTFMPLTTTLLGGLLYTPVPRVVPAALEELAYPGLTGSAPDFVARCATGALIVLVLIGLSLVRRTWRRNRTLFLTAAALIAATAASDGALLLATVASLDRLGTQEALMFRLAAVLLLAILIDAKGPREDEAIRSPSDEAVLSTQEVG